MNEGEALAVLSDMPSASVDAVIADPPYSSGGLMRGDRALVSAVDKYVSTGAVRAGESFTGDNRDQRSYVHWSALWLSQALRVSKPGAICAVFTDWRQLPATTDAVQAGGWVWRGIVVWSKTTARPTRGGFRNSAEYLVWASNGPMRKDYEVYLPGVITTAIARGGDKHHITAKPVELMDVLVQAAPPGGVVLDPFMGSGSTGVACARQGRDFVGVELSPAYASVARQRIDQTRERERV